MTTTLCMSQFNILLVEDDPIDVMTVQRAFHRAQVTHPIVVANDGEEALRRLDAGDVGQPCLIMTDLHMPGMDGLDLLRALRAHEKYRSLPVVVLTTSNAEQDKIASFHLNVAGYILKPIQFEQFVSAMISVSRYWSLSEHPQ